MLFQSSLRWRSRRLGSHYRRSLAPGWSEEPCRVPRFQMTPTYCVFLEV